MDRMWYKLVVFQFKVLSWHVLDRLRKIMKSLRIVSVLPEVELDTSQKQVQSVSALD
jgi:hypothetical protein